jgi:hypothetical protein
MQNELIIDMNESEENESKFDYQQPVVMKKLASTTSIDEIIEKMNNTNHNSIDNIKPSTNGWDDDANDTIRNWYNTFKENSYIYQYIIDRNQKIASKLNLISIVSSSVLGIFSSFKLWLHSDYLFSVTSDIMLIFFNFGIAAITSTSKNYLDGERNERIKSYIEQNDKFVGELAAQVLKSPIYRMNAMEFFTQNNDIYTKLITTAPNLSLDEITRAKDKYNKIKEHRLA